MKAFLSAVLLLIAYIAGLALLPTGLPREAVYGLSASLGGVLVVAASVMVLSRPAARRDVELARRGEIYADRPARR